MFARRPAPSRRAVCAALLQAGLIVLSTADCASLARFRRAARSGPRVQAQPSTAQFPQGVDATQYRLLLPLLRPQKTDPSCSAAAVALVISGLRSARGLAPVSEHDIVASDPTGRWARLTAQGGDGVGLDALQFFAMRARATLAGPRGGPGIVDVVHVPSADKPPERQTEGRQAFAFVLGRSQASPTTSFVLLNAPQSRLFAGGDPVGHFVVVAGYDQDGERVLVIDVDDTVGLEPFWLRLRDAWAAMQAPDDVTGETRGYLWLRSGD